MRILDNFHHEHLRVEHSVLFGNHSLCHGEYACEYGDIKYDCPVWRDLKMEENVWVEDRSEDKDRSEGTRYERDESGVHNNSDKIATSCELRKWK